MHKQDTEWADLQSFLRGKKIWFCGGSVIERIQGLAIYLRSFAPQSTHEAKPGLQPDSHTSSDSTQHNFVELVPIKCSVEKCLSNSRPSVFEVVAVLMWLEQNNFNIQVQNESREY